MHESNWSQEAHEPPDATTKYPNHTKGGMAAKKRKKPQERSADILVRFGSFVCSRQTSTLTLRPVSTLTSQLSSTLNYLLSARKNIMRLVEADGSMSWERFVSVPCQMGCQLFGLPRLVVASIP